MASEIKFFEVRDRATFIPVMAVCLGASNPAEWYLLRRSGYVSAAWNQDDDGRYVVLCKLDPVEAQYDPFKWPSPRTMPAAHRFIQQHWRELTSGDVVDVEFILGETAAPTPGEARDAV